MSILTIDFDQKSNQPIKDYKTINKYHLTLEDLNLIDNHYQDYSYILIKKGDLIKRLDFNPEDFYLKNLKNTDIDIYILSTYSEKCHNLNKVDEYNDYTFYKSRMPGEVEAFMFSSDKWSKIKPLLENSSEVKITKAFKNLAHNEDLNMVFSWPQAYYRRDKNMMQICREENIGIIEPKIKEISYYWFFLNLVFSVFFLYIIYDKIPKDRFYFLDKI